MQGEFDDASEAFPDGYLPPASGTTEADGLDAPDLPREDGPLDGPLEEDDLPAGEDDQRLDDQGLDDPDGLGDSGEALTEEAEEQQAHARWIRNVGLVGFTGGSFRIKSGGPVAVGPGLAAGRDVINIIQDGTHRVRPHSGAVGSDLLDALRTAWVDVPSLKPLRGRLEHHRIQVLRGAEGSGRFAVAARALDGLATVVERLDPDVAPWDLLSDHLEQRHGYIVDATTADWVNDLTQSRLASIEEQLEEAKAYLVLLVDDRTPLDDDASNAYLVRHQPPDPEAVLWVHLRDLLVDADRRVAQLYERAVPPGRAGDETGDPPDSATIGKAVAAELRHSPRPGRVVDLAQHLASAILDDLPPDEVLARLRSRLREEVRVWFLDRATGATPNTGRPAPARTLWDRTFLISCAVLHELPVGRVTAAADRLASLLLAVESPGEARARPVFRDLEDVCGQYVRITDATDGRRGWSGTDTTPVVTLRSPKLPDVTLDVVWRHYDAAREPLLTWLEEMVAGSDQMLRDRAAQAVGKLATYGFAELYQRVIGPWAGSGRVSERRAAAWALEVVAADGRFASQARRRVRRWSRGGPAQRHAAVLAYGTYLGAIFPDDALRNLERLAEDPRYADDQAVARSLVAVLADVPPADVLVTLTRWAAADRPALRLHAARCLVRLGRIPAFPPDGAWPALLEAVVRDPALWAPLVELWRLALATARTAGPAWGLLRRWIRQADGEPPLSGPVGLLVTGLLQEPELSGRTRFHVWLWRHQAARPSPTLDQLRSPIT